MPKLLYILPEASKNTHMKYNVEFLKDLARTIDIFLILERGGFEDAKKQFEGSNVKIMEYTGNGNPVFRIIKLVSYLFKGKKLGYTKVYAHYSFVGAFFASLIPGVTVYYWNCGIPWQYKRPFFQELYESLTYKLIDHFVVGVSVLTKKYAEFYKFNVKKSIVVPNWVNVSEIKNKYILADRNEVMGRYNIGLDKKVLFFIQRLSTRKGAHHIVPIIEQMPEDVVVIVTGDGPYKKTLEDEVKVKKLEDRIKILGRVDNSKMPELLKATDIFILPSEEEGMSHALMEAFACGVPSVAFNVGGTIDMFPEGFKDYVVNERDLPAFVQKLKYLFSHKEQMKSLSSALENKVKEYDKQVVLKEFVEKIVLN